MEVTIEREKWIALSPEEKEILEKMGVKPAEEPKLKKKRRKLKEKWFSEHRPYILGVYIKCGLCKTIEHRQYKMIPLWDPAPHYQSKLVKRNGHILLEQCTEEKWQSTCPHCHEVLATHNKEELIHKLTIYARYCAALESRR